VWKKNAGERREGDESMKDIRKGKKISGKDKK
jgi:hypothetical protein